MDISIAGAANASLSALSTFVQGVIAVRDENLTQAVKAELLSKINAALLSANSLITENAELSRANRELDAKNGELMKAIDEREKYALHQLPTGALVYRYEVPGDEKTPAHNLCARCWDVDHKKSILQPLGNLFHCTECKTNFRFKADSRQPGTPGKGTWQSR